MIIYERVFVILFPCLSAILLAFFILKCVQELIKPREEEFGSEMSLQMELALAGQGTVLSTFLSFKYMSVRGRGVSNVFGPYTYLIEFLK